MAMSSRIPPGLLLGLAWAAAGCEAPPAGPQLVGEDLADLPLAGSDEQQRRDFRAGDALFETAFRESDGLGPLYIRTACGACHENAGKGPGLVRKLQVVGPDGVTPLDAPGDLPWGNTLRPYTAGGATRPLLAPESLPDGHQLLVSERIGPTVLGRGYVEAVTDAEIERVAAEQGARADGTAGRIARLEDGSIGRFGLKARLATLEAFTADAFQGDMGLTSPLRPEEVPNPEGLADDRRPGPDLDGPAVTAVATYIRLLEIPTRDARAAAGPGPALFQRARCAGCHVPSLRTRADHPVPQLAGIQAPLYSDLLLHDMGEGLADGITEADAGPREWRTPPLIGLRFQRSFLHDGRARDLEQAVLDHAGEGSQANGSVQAFQALSARERRDLIEFVSSL
jgi:CxxC motif-containing protein (DUF1111 family)